MLNNEWKDIHLETYSENFKCQNNTQKASREQITDFCKRTRIVLALDSSAATVDIWEQCKISSTYWGEAISYL